MLLSIWVFIINIAGIEIKIIKRDGIADWKNWAWLTKSYVNVARVSKLNGLMIKVSGNSFEISMKTIRPAIIMGLLKIGKFMFFINFKGFTFNVLDAWFTFLQNFSMLESIGCHATAKNLTMYEKISPNIDPINTIETKSLIALPNFNIPIAIIAPGIEYPRIANWLIFLHASLLK